jgi:hypothetical protein
VARVGGGRARTVGGCKLLRDEIPPQVNVICLISRKHLAVVDRQPSGKKRAAGWRAVPVDVVVGENDALVGQGRDGLGIPEECMHGAGVCIARICEYTLHTLRTCMRSFNANAGLRGASVLLRPLNASMPGLAKLIRLRLLKSERVRKQHVVAQLGGRHASTNKQLLMANSLGC